jgi:hypothetical protein
MRQCTGSGTTIERYQRKVSGPAVSAEPNRAHCRRRAEHRISSRTTAAAVGFVSEGCSLVIRYRIRVPGAGHILLIVAPDGLPALAIGHLLPVPLEHASRAIDEAKPGQVGAGDIAVSVVDGRTLQQLMHVVHSVMLN